jgi:hypothetical protein
MSVNPAIPRELAMFAAVVARLKRCEVVPPEDAFVSEFDGVRFPSGARGSAILDLTAGGQG